MEPLSLDQRRIPDSGDGTPHGRFFARIFARKFPTDSMHPAAWARRDLFRKYMVLGSHSRILVANQ